MRILLAIDGSDESGKAVDQLARLPFVEKPEITIVTALRESPLDLRTDSQGVAIYEAEKRTAEANIAEAKGKLADVCDSLDHVIKHRHPSTLILDIAESIKPDLIVMGARGHNAIYRVVVGSTADQVASHAKCSVLVTRGTLGKEGDWNLLLPFDGSPPAKLAAHQMCSFNWPENASVHLAMMLEKPKLIADDDTYDVGAINESRDELEKLDVNGLNCKVKRTVGETYHIGNSLRTIAEEDPANLMFVGATGKSAIARFFLGSVSRYLLNHADCSIWIVREKAWN